MKVAIIGAGICGLYLAWKLSEKGQDVTVFEKKNEIGQRICSGLFSQRILEFLPQSQKLIKNEIKSTFLHFPSRTVELSFSKKIFLIDHFELDKLAASLAEKSGAKIVLNNNISSLPEGFDRIIGCDGADSQVRKILNLPEPAFRLGMQVFVKKEYLSDFVEVWPCKNGFFWKIPRGETIEYGIIAAPEKAKKLFEDFLKKNNILIENIKARIIPQGFVVPVSFVATLCGDAAGLTKPWSGGGVVWGLKSAEILLRTFPDFPAYRRALRRFFLPKIILSKIASKLVYFLGFKAPLFLPKRTTIESDFLL